MRIDRALFALPVLSLMVVGGGACAPETVAPPPAPPVNWASLADRAPVDAGPPRATAKEREAAASYATALASPGFAELAALLDENARFAFGGKNAHGRDRVVASHAALFGAFDQRVVAVSRVWMNEHSQAVEWTLTGTHTRDYAGIAPTRRPVAVKGVTLLFTNDDGSIVDVHVAFDEALVKAQLGVGPAELQKLAAPVAPSGAPVVIERRSTAEEAANLTPVRAMLDALEEDKESAYLDALSELVEISSPEHPEPTRGKDAARAYFRAMRKAVAQLDTAPHGAFGAGDFAVVEYSISGEQVGPIAWIPAAKSRVFRMHVVDIAEVHGGKISRIWRYDNPTEILTP